ncbi:PQQ-binding-like beta-propeller repeat protein [Halorussus sp. MSC15.2]|uniref:outer membrane protein assembly factor BamB family protein n=1 Tax=Halorussus sp. MSC15.2 TaxID=2283638 RepID=UPI0013D084EC|nr:PQQ-binding-like beta-propeller repeat protein [Halorussus sp. MSC15.2]NEU56779.1 PQQ-binding-like beta-propeller repeat protein [Halorussus sp. MSC15.2]
MVSPTDVDDDRRRLLAGVGVAAFGDVSLGERGGDGDGRGGSERNGDSDDDTGERSGVHPDWRTRGFDAGNTSYNHATTGPTERGLPTWHFWEFTTGPVVADGTVYVGGRGGWGDDRTSDGVYAVDPETGERKWEATFEDASFGRPTVFGGTVYAFGSEDVLYALDAATGEERWRYADAANVGTPVVADGTVFLGGRERLVALDAETGAHRWEYGTTDGIAYSPAVRRGRVFASEGTWRTSEHRLHAFDAATGERRWTYEYPDDCEFVRTAPTVGEGTVFVGGGSHDIDKGLGRVVALDANTGEVAWSWVGDEPMNQTMALAHDTLYVPTKGAFTALDATTGEERWQFAVDSADRNPMARIDRFSPPAVVGDTVYVGGYDAAVYALDARAGTCRWRYALGETSRASSQPAVVDGTVYVACDHLYAFSETGDASVEANFVFENTGPGPEHEIRVGRRVTFWGRLTTGR